MHFLTRRLVLPSDLNYGDSLFGGRVLQWIDEEAAIYAICQLETNYIVTKHIGEVSFEAPALKGDVIEFGLETKKVGKTSITISCLVRNKATKKTICFASEIVFVQIDPQSRKPIAHGKTLEQLAKDTAKEMDLLKATSLN